MFQTSLKFLIFAVISKRSVFVKATGTECTFYSECRNISKCPYIEDKFNELSALGSVPYCNLKQTGTHVCCPVPQPPYYAPEDEDRPIVRACKSYKSLRKCENIPLIIGGKKAAAKEFPFMALLMNKNGADSAYYCGGILISSRYVLTAAHCFMSPMLPNIVRLGELDYTTTQDDASPIDFKIFNYTLHPKYNYYEKLNDIALIELDRNVAFNDYIFPACLPLPNGRDFESCRATGFGATSDISFGRMSSHLLKVNLDTYDSDKCEEIIGADSDYPINTTMQMCAGSVDGTRDTCLGDSGGPLFVDHPDDGYRCLHLILGLTSYSQGCGNADYPAIYVRLSFYIDWIEKMVWP